MQRSFHYAWVVAAVTFMVLLVTAGIRATPGVLMVPLESEFGWNRAVISGAVAINIALFGLIGPFAASVMDRWGLRRVVLVRAGAAGGVGRADQQMSNQWQLTLLWGVLVGTGTGVTSMVLAAVVATRWFDERRGLVLGALSAANATGQLVFLPLLASLVEHARLALGGARSVAAAAVVVFVIVCVFMRDRPEDLGLLPYGRHAGDSRDGAARRSRRWRRCAMAHAVHGVLDPGRHVLHLRREHERPDRHAPHRGLSRLRHFTGPIGAAARRDGHLRHRRHDGIGLADRSLLEPPSAVRLLHAAGHFAALPSARRSQSGARGLGWFAVFYGLDWIATVPPTVRLTSEAFGRENTGVIYGWIGASHQLGASMAAFGAGAIRTMAGDYRLAFWIAGTLCVLAGTSFLAVRRTFSSPLGRRRRHEPAAV